MGSERNARAFARPYHAGAETAPLRENHRSRYPRVFPARPSVPGWPPVEGRAPHARKEGPGLTEARRHRPTASGPPILGNERPRHEHGLAMRTHGVHPSEKTVFRVISGSSPEGHPSSALPLRGGAGSARPQGRHHANSNIAPFWPRTPRPPVGRDDMPRFGSGRYFRTRRAHPSEKIASRAIPEFSPRGHPSSDSPRGGAGLARPQELHDANPYVASFWPPTFRAPVRNHDLPRFASGPYLRTRGVRPSEKTAFHVLSGTPPKGPLLERPRMA